MKKITPITALILVVAMILLGECSKGQPIEAEAKAFVISEPTHYYDSITWELKPIER